MRSPQSSLLGGRFSASGIAQQTRGLESGIADPSEVDRAEQMWEFVSAGSLFFRDVKYIVEAVLTFAIFFTPVFYDVQMFGEKGKWLLINPAAPILEGFSDCVTRQQWPDLSWFGYSFVFALVAFVGGYVFFKHLEPAFAESI